MLMPVSINSSREDKATVVYSSFGVNVLVVGAHLLFLGFQGLFLAWLALTKDWNGSRHPAFMPSKRRPSAGSDRGAELLQSSEEMGRGGDDLSSPCVYARLYDPVLKTASIVRKTQIPGGMIPVMIPGRPEEVWIRREVCSPDLLQSWDSGRH